MPGRLLWYNFAVVYTFAVLSYSNCIACDVIMQNEQASVPPFLLYVLKLQFENKNREREKKNEECEKNE